jgi:hypothetical protein
MPASDQNMLYFYDQQIKRYLIQLIRIFSNFRVAENTRDGVKYNRVPARYGDISRMVASIINKNSENTVTAAPVIALTISGLKLSRERTQDPFFSDVKQVIEKKFDTDQQKYLDEPGNKYTVHRYMPVPYTLSINVDIWTTNTDMKLQLLEQICVLFNPSIQLQSNSNALDWSNVFEVELTDLTFSSKSIPVGTDESNDIATLTFDVPIWISPPAKVLRQSIIEQIITDVHSVSDMTTLGYSPKYYDFFGDIPDTFEIITTPGDYRVMVTENTVQLQDPAGNPSSWNSLLLELKKYLTPSSLIKLNTTNDSDNDLDLVVGSVSHNELDDSLLDFVVDPDTLPSNTLGDITKIIDPTMSNPFTGLDPQQTGQRYLITQNLPQTPAWGFLTAHANDIIAYNGSNWVVAFDSQNSLDVQYVTNLYTGNQYKWTGSDWIHSYQGSYNPGYWRLSV